VDLVERSGRRIRATGGKERFPRPFSCKYRA
jgi:hypothetical protein